MINVALNFIYQHFENLSQFLHVVVFREIVDILLFFQEIDPIILSVGEEDEVSIMDAVKEVTKAFEFKVYFFRRFSETGQPDFRARNDAVTNIQYNTVVFPTKTE